MTSSKRVALITGGARRVGAAIVRRLSAGGFDVAFTYQKSRGVADQLVAELRAAGGRAQAIEANLLDLPVSVDQIGAVIESDFGRLDVLVNNASIYEPGQLGKIDLDQARRMWTIHVAAPLLLCQRFAALLRASHGHVVNMLDAQVARPPAGYMPYTASKAGLWNLTLALARELAPEVTVNGIAPGVAEWPPDFPESQRREYLRHVPLARAGTPADIAAAVAYLCSEGSYLTGQVLTLDGGRSLE
jgi:pteridine reductase